MEIAGYNMPEELYYDQYHFWTRVDGDELVIGMDDFAEKLAGQIVFVQLPFVGKAVTAGKKFAKVESGKWLGTVYSPTDGEITAVNEELEANPTAGKLYTDSGKTISDGIKVHTLNGQKPTLGLDERGNYVILRPGENRLSVGFVGLKDFAVSVAATTATKAPVEAAETQAEIVCQAEPRRNYKIVFDKATSAFSVEPY